MPSLLVLTAWITQAHEESDGKCGWWIFSHGLRAGESFAKVFMAQTTPLRKQSEGSVHSAS